MVEQHRRVESRSIVGTGMATDAERIRDIETEAERRTRAEHVVEAKFGDVLARAPAHAEIDGFVKERERKKAEAPAPDVETQPAPAPVALPEPPSAKPVRKAKGPPPPDPRAKLLHAQLARQQKPKP